jgi:transposase-like protein
MRTKRRWSPSEKQQIVLELLAPGVNVAEVCRAHGLHSAQAYEWRRTALDGIKQALSGSASPDARLKAENARLKRLVSDQALGLQAYREVLEGSAEGKNDGGRSATA